MTEPLTAKIGEHLDNPIVFTIVLILVAYSVLSKRLAELSGPFKALGGLARWWNGRQIARVQRQRELWKAQHDSDWEREDAEMAQLRHDVNYLTRELADMRRREQLRDQQARAHTAWDNAWVPRAQALGLDIPEPPPLYLDLAPLHIPEETS